MDTARIIIESAGIIVSAEVRACSSGHRRASATCGSLTKRLHCCIVCRT
jgi:hypothetical protein